MFKPALSRGELQCIGATTLDEYRQYIEKDGALDRRFQKIMVDPTSVDETIQILKNIKHKYEEHHGVHYSDKAIDLCRPLERPVHHRPFPSRTRPLTFSTKRVHGSTWRTFTSPKRFVISKRRVEKIKQSKNQVVKNQNFEEAARLRDLEKKLLSDLEIAKREWELKAQDTVYQVSEKSIWPTSWR
jgi:ATP-dependent Clp protease ATP-binding subunit ClpC